MNKYLIIFMLKMLLIKPLQGEEKRVEYVLADMSVTEEGLISARSRTNPNEQWLLIIALKTINYGTDRNN